METFLASAFAVICLQTIQEFHPMSFEYKCTIYQKDDNILQPVVLFIKYIELIAKYTYTYHVLPNIFQWVQDSAKKTYFARI